MSIISCPRCDIALKKIGLGLLCRQCEGCWLKFDELDEALAATDEELVASGLKPTLCPDSPGVNLSPSISCPICSEKMRRFPYMMDSGVLVDVCKTHGMWLDDGELGAIRSYCQYAGIKVEPEKKAGFFANLLKKLR